MKKLVMILAAALGGALIVVACSDDSPGDVDAAVCDCPAAEKPITAARLHRVDVADVLRINDIVPVGASCPAGEILLTGSCYVDQDNTARDVYLYSSGANPSTATTQPTGWDCVFMNKSITQTAMIRAQVTCLRP